MRFWKLVQDYVDTTGAREAAIMRRAGLNKGTFTAWRQRGIPALPTHMQLLALADAIHVNYEVMLQAILEDLSYLPESAARAHAGDGADESGRMADAEQRYGLEVHAEVSRLIKENGFSVARATEVATGAARDYLLEIKDGKVSFLIDYPYLDGLRQGGDGSDQDPEFRRAAAIVADEYEGAVAADDGDGLTIEEEQGHDEHP